MTEREPWGENVLVEFDAGIAWVTMNRPAKRNAMNPALIAEMKRTVEVLATDDRCGVFVLTGAGESFTAGMDLQEYFRETDAAPLLHALRHLELHVLVQIADRRHARSFVDRLLDLRRNGDILENEAGHLEPVLRRDDRIDERQQRLPQLRITARDIEYRNLRGREGICEDAHDARSHRVGELVEPEILVGAGNLLEEQFRSHDAEVVGAEGAHAHDPEILVAHHDRICGPPFVAREQARVEVVHVGLERRVEPVLPRLEPRQDGDVVGGQRVLAGPEGVAELAEINELDLLRLADDQLRAVLDGLVLVWKTEGQRVA